MSKKRITVSMPDLLTVLNNHIELFECAEILMDLQEFTQNLVQQDKRPSDEQLESFHMLVSAIRFIGTEAEEFIKELEGKQTQIN